MDVVLNSCYGGFGLSDLALEEYAKLTEMKTVRSTPRWDGDRGYCFLTSDHSLPNVISDKQWNSSKTITTASSIPREDKALVAVVKRLGNKANGEHAELRIVSIPDGVSYEIEEYDGKEWIAETHRTWS